MPITTLTSKGQMTLPKAVRDQLGLQAGDRLDVVIEGDHIVIRPKSLHISDIVSFLPAPKRARSIEEINEAIAAAAIERGLRGRS